MKKTAILSRQSLIKAAISLGLDIKKNWASDRILEMIETKIESINKSIYNRGDSASETPEGGRQATASGNIEPAIPNALELDVPAGRSGSPSKGVHPITGKPVY